MTTLRDEIAADQGKPTQCGVCLTMSRMDEKARKEWDDVLNDQTFTHASIARAAARRRIGFTRSSIETHRKNLHRIK